MTDEEMAKEQIKKWDSILYPQMYPVALVKDFIRKSFLAGLKAGKPKWHDLRKNPADLPPIKENRKYTSINVLTDEGKIVFYSYRANCWFDFNVIEIDPPKAWCEIPSFSR